MLSGIFAFFADLSVSADVRVSVGFGVQAGAGVCTWVSSLIAVTG